jgi:RimJ/RimL family protein N-acetyltransferase
MADELQRILAVSGDPRLAPSEQPPREQSATQVVTGYDVAVVEWMRRQLGTAELDPFGPAVAIGVARNSDLIAGIAFYSYRRPNIEVVIVATTPSWCSRRNLAAIFAYPFRQLGCRRLSARVEAGNLRARRFLGGLGFEVEGLCRQALPPTPATPSGDAVLFGMLADECPWFEAGPGLRARLRALRRPAAN